ncbi:hypothetical protein chiPu_0022500 [Chiloscyllium punctatum]|uniref:Uncharacterized protein n=1 Tax=Chiloscyllium punctatum TaxID=137246 RepID=A0A401RI69_CHIPU|nr:hypothetical protein [Chiloscyllium punctatum]
MGLAPHWATATSVPDVPHTHWSLRTSVSFRGGRRGETWRPLVMRERVGTNGRRATEGGRANDRHWPGSGCRRTSQWVAGRTNGEAGGFGPALALARRSLVGARVRLGKGTNRLGEWGGIRPTPGA